MRLLRQALNILWWRLGGKNPLFGPLRVQWDLTYKCNSRCLHCSRWRPEFRASFKRAPELDTFQAKRLIRQLAELGVIQLCFSGSEPILRKDIFELVRFAKKQGLQVTFLTNGLAMDTKAAGQIVDSGVDVLFFSLDGSTSAINDKVRGVKGALEKTLRAVRLCRQARGRKKMKIMASTVISRNNINDLEKIASLAKKSGFDGLIPHPLIVYPVAAEAEQSLVISPQDLDKLDQQIERTIKKFGDFIPVMGEYFQHIATFYTQPEELYRYPCVAGFLSLDIHPNGDFVPCPVWREKMGNFVKTQSVKNIWFSKKAKLVREKVRQGRHPICWAGCLWPMNLYLYYLHPLRFHKLFNKKMLKYIFKKIGVSA